MIKIPSGWTLPLSPCCEAEVAIVFSEYSNHVDLTCLDCQKKFQVAEKDFQADPIKALARGCADWSVQHARSH